MRKRDCIVKTRSEDLYDLDSERFKMKQKKWSLEKNYQKDKHKYNFLSCSQLIIFVGQILPTVDAKPKTVSNPAGMLAFYAFRRGYFLSINTREGGRPSKTRIRTPFRSRVLSKFVIKTLPRAQVASKHHCWCVSLCRRVPAIRK